MYLSLNKNNLKKKKEKKAKSKKPQNISPRIHSSLRITN
jgi:hypothetical protein